MTPRARADVQSALRRKGFVQSDNDHEKFIYFLSNGKKSSVWTKTSRGSSHREISAGNLGKMARQCRLSSSDFEDLIDCPLSPEDYEQKLIQGGHVAY